MDTYLMYAITALLLIISYLKDKKKTLAALKKAWKAFENILPELLVMLLFIGLLLSLLNPEFISGVIGPKSGFYGVILAAVVGAVTLIPGFVAFPMAAMLLEGGAGYMQIGAFVSALMMVGVVTLPVEIRYFGKRLAFLRNFLAFLFSFLVAYIIGWAVGSV